MPGKSRAFEFYRAICSVYPGFQHIGRERSGTE
jgi:hypothetical protein